MSYQWTKHAIDLLKKHYVNGHNTADYTANVIRGATGIPINREAVRKKGVQIRNASLSPGAGEPIEVVIYQAPVKAVANLRPMTSREAHIALSFLAACGTILPVTAISDCLNIEPKQVVASVSALMFRFAETGTSVTIQNKHRHGYYMFGTGADLDALHDECMRVIGGDAAIKAADFAASRLISRPSATPALYCGMGG